MKKRGVEVIVVCDDKDVEEYATQHVDERRVTSYIASEIGKRFVLEVANDTELGFTVQILCDGAETSTWFLDPHEDSGLWDGVLGEGTSVRPYIFSRLCLTDKEEEAPKTDREIECLGTISVALYRSSLRERDPTDAEHRPRMVQNPKLDDTPVHEKNKKVGMHAIILGEPIDGGNVESVPITSMYGLDPMETPYAWFTWYYRPKDYLQAQGIIPSEHPKGQRAGRGRGGASKSASKASTRRKQAEVDSDPEDLLTVLYRAKRAASEDGDYSPAKRPRVDASEAESSGSNRPRTSERLRSKPPRNWARTSP
ncbi:hypothetical protein BDW22DRAFT_1057025 [Trametopsis cervina]|nr:hypothetical protein BDW22DRAFT_1057025 [Trametopsis cervina]